MNPEFKYSELHYKTEDVATLKTILECNNRRISAALSIAFDELFRSVPPSLRAVFIVEQCEKILSGHVEPEGQFRKQFNFNRTPEAP